MNGLHERTHMKLIKVITGLALLILFACSRTENAEHHEHGDHEEAEKGPHGGRLLEDGHFAVEVTIFERGTPPEFRLYASEDGKAIKPSAVSYRVELTRFGGKSEQFTFTAKD